MGNENLPIEGAAWTASLMKELPTVPVSASLQNNILASFDTVVARRNSGFIGALRKFAGSVWPGVPAWRPAAALAFSLIVGIVAGTVVPMESAMADSGEQQINVALDAPPSFDLDENS